MDLSFNGRYLHLPAEMISHICSFLETPSDACTARLVNRAFCAAATPLIINIWVSPSLLFVRSNISSASGPYGGTGIDPDNRPLWVEKPVTLWTWLNIPASIALEDGKSAVGEQFGRLLCAPDGFGFSNTRRRSFHVYGRKALSWGRVRENPDAFCIITQWDCQHSLDLYRDSVEAHTLRTFLDEVAPGCISSSTSEYLPMAPQCKNGRPLFGGLYQIRTIYFKSGMTQEQRRMFEETDPVYRHRVKMLIVHPHLERSPWWWLHGLRTFNGTIVVAARLALGFKRFHSNKAIGTRRLSDTDSEQPTSPVMGEKFEEELQVLGKIGSTSFHCDFHTGPWRN